MRKWKWARAQNEHLHLALPWCTGPRTRNGSCRLRFQNGAKKSRANKALFRRFLKLQLDVIDRYRCKRWLNVGIISYNAGPGLSQHFALAAWQCNKIPGSAPRNCHGVCFWHASFPDTSRVQIGKSAIMVVKKPGLPPQTHLPDE